MFTKSYVDYYDQNIWYWYDLFSSYQYDHYI